MISFRNLRTRTFDLIIPLWPNGNNFPIFPRTANLCFYDSNEFVIVFITFIIPFIWQITSM